MALSTAATFVDPDGYAALVPGSPDAVLAGNRAATVHQRRVARTVVVLVVVAFGALVAPRTAQPSSRYALTAALVDGHTVDLGAYRPMLEIDRAVYQGHLRSDKGPGQPVLAAPFYALARLAGAPAVSAAPRLRGDLMLWWLTLWTSLLPFALLCALVYRRCARVAPRRALTVTLALMLGSIALPPAVNLYAHSLSALLGYAAWAAIADGEPSRSRVALAGFLAAAAVATEYELAIVAAVVAVVVLCRAPRRVLLFVAGAIAPTAALAFYQWRAFDAPWHTPFAYYAGTLGGTTHGGYTVPHAQWLFDAMIGNRGLLVTSPIVMLAVAAALVVAWKRPALRLESAVALVVFAAYLALVAGWTGTPWLEEPGPRYLIPAIPFLAVPLAASWRRVRVLGWCAALWGGFLMIGAATTFILVATNDTPVNAYVNRLAHHRFVPTVWSLELGVPGAGLYAASVVLALFWFVRTERRRLRTVRERVWIH